MYAVRFAEVRRAARALVRSPVVSICAVLCLALGIGATTAIASAVSRALLQSFPLRNPQRLVAVHRITPQSGAQGTWPESAPNFVDLARASRQVEQLSAFTYRPVLLTLPQDAVRASGLAVSGSLFSMLGARAQVGRLIGPADDRTDAPRVAVMSDDFWRQRFGGDPAVVGRTMLIDGEPTTIVGVTTPDFRFPHGARIVRPELWLPLRLSSQQLALRRQNYLSMLGRLAPGATVQSAQTEMRGIFANLASAYPELNGENLRVAPLVGENVQQVRQPLLLLLGAVGLVLLIAATNVAALLLARGVQRRRELGVRAALGATRRDLLRPALIESALLTAAGVILGLGIARIAIGSIGRLAAARLPQLEGLALDGRVLAFALAISVVTAFICGVVPTLRSATVDPQDALRGGRGGGAGREHHRVLRLLAVGEIGLSLLLLIGAGLVLKAFATLLASDPGFDPGRVLSMQVIVSAQQYQNQSEVARFLEPALEAVRSVPGVQAVAAINAVPYRAWGINSNIRYEGQPADNPTEQPIVEQRLVTPDFFSVTEQRLLEGRLLRESDDDRPESPLVVVVNEALAKRDFPGRSAVGMRFYVTDTSFATIVGVVSDIKNAGPVAPPAPEMYWTYRQTGGSSTFPLMVRVRRGDPRAVIATVTAAIRGVDPQAAVSDIMPMNDVIARSLGEPRFYFSLLGSFAGVAIILTIAGLYGVLSYSVAQRTREIGIRSALGSSRAGVVRLIGLEGARIVAAGVVIGIAGGVAATRLLGAMLYDVSPLDVTAWGAAILVMLVAAAVAVITPARRASRVDPVIAMRVE
ncbi:MAG TPA: ABC transporter permease [Gemmatimonadaceae bacterium]|nr:ABC transporter permease [Gemmatimonadaceae bacterium]